MTFKRSPRTTTRTFQLTKGQGVNNSPYVTIYTNEDGKRVICPIFHTWTQMLDNSTKNHITIHKPWLHFNTFRLWVEQQNYENKIMRHDLFDHLSTLYSPDTCVFVDRATSNLFHNKGKERDLPHGVYHSQNTQLPFKTADGMLFESTEHASQHIYNLFTINLNKVLNQSDIANELKDRILNINKV